jgi:hypothetical protein
VDFDVVLDLLLHFTAGWQWLAETVLVLEEVEVDGVPLF